MAQKLRGAQVARHIRRHVAEPTCERHIAVQENRRTDVLQVRGHPKADGGRGRWTIASAKQHYGCKHPTAHPREKLCWVPQRRKRIYSSLEKRLLRLKPPKHSVANAS